MKKFEKFIIPITILLLVFLGWVFISNPKAEKPTTSVSDTNPLDSKSGTMGAVNVQVTPLSTSNFEITLNTHSVELDFDLKKIITLTDNEGNEYQPVSWSGDRGGHHLSGELQFSTMNPQATTIFLTITEIEGEVLKFEWAL
ncbi:MAG: hypothetical protein ACOZAO_04950 [Patescibacteria group bacterium]